MGAAPHIVSLTTSDFVLPLNFSLLLHLVWYSKPGPCPKWHLKPSRLCRFDCRVEVCCELASVRARQKCGSRAHNGHKGGLATHTHTHTHMLVFMVYGDFHRRNGFYTVQTVCAIALHLNLALTGDGAFILSPKKHSVWFISILNYGDTENVLINHLLLVMPMSYHVIIQICVLNHINAHTHTHTTHTHTHSDDIWAWI